MKPDNISISFIKEVVEDHFGLKRGTVDYNTKKWDVVKYRQICHHFAFELGKFEMYIIGKEMGNKGIETVRHSRRKVFEQINNNSQYRKDIESIEYKLKNPDSKDKKKLEIIYLLREIYGERSLQQRLIESIFCCD
jgi:chromosomal replication initiation ATPase DnaA